MKELRKGRVGRIKAGEVMALLNESGTGEVMFVVNSCYFICMNIHNAVTSLPKTQLSLTKLLLLAETER